MRKERFSVLLLVLLVFIVVGCKNMGATNTTPTNVAVTSYEAAGNTLTQAYNLEKYLLRAGKITPEQDKEFQLGVYAKAVTCYKAVGTAAVAVLLAKDAVSKKTATDKFNTLSAQLPVLIDGVLKFLDSIKK